MKGRRSLVSETLPQLSRRAIRPSEVGQQNGIEHRGFAHELGHRERGAGGAQGFEFSEENAKRP